MPAAGYPSKTARSSAKAMVLAASLTGCQSGSLAPRSTSSTAWRSTVNGTRNSMIGWEVRARAMTPWAGGALHVRDPAACHVALEGAGGFLLDAGPGGGRDGGEFAVQVVHDGMLLFRLPTPSEPSARTSGAAGTSGDAGTGATAAASAARGSGRLSRK